MPPTRKELAAKYIRRKLERGELPPGARLSDLALSKEMGISRTPVREAIQALVAEGVAEATPHAGVFIKTLNRDDVRELYELREALESFAAARAAARGASLPDIRERLRQCCQTLRELEAEAKTEGWEELPAPKTLEQREADLAFHRLLIKACQNARIARTVEESALHTRLFATMPETMKVTTLRSARKCHEAVLRAIDKSDPEAARAAMAEHIRRGLEGRLADWRDTPVTGELADMPSALRELMEED